ncbi:hypothetical protein [Streptantibioticus cattleyicolor]|nr:hypothetical protein [Streptantibioticus cattleyicolor]CCB71490.1 protein of unknown function [Streptantibioticus cattleyicolor NRRL 8057 = DSM 46488]
MTSTSKPALTAERARHVHRRRVGPRRPGGVYTSGTDGETYVVLAVHYGADARAALGHPMGWAVTVRTADGRERTHCTPWDPRRDRVRGDLCPRCLGPLRRHPPGGPCPARV